MTTFVYATPYFVCSPEESVSTFFIILAWGIIFVIVLVTIYLILKYSEGFNRGWLFLTSHLSAGFSFAGIGLPMYWTNFASTKLAMFIRVVGTFCLMLIRSIIPVNPDFNEMVFDNKFLAIFVYGMAYLFVAYFVYFSFLVLVYGLIYLIKGNFIYQNFFENLGASLLRGVASVAKIIFTLAVSTYMFASSITGVDVLQAKVFNASHDQLVSTKMRKAVDWCKEYTGYNTQSSSSSSSSSTPKAK